MFSLLNEVKENEEKTHCIIPLDGVMGLDSLNIDLESIIMIIIIIKLCPRAR